MSRAKPNEVWVMEYKRKDEGEKDWRPNYGEKFEATEEMVKRHIAEYPQFVSPDFEFQAVKYRAVR